MRAATYLAIAFGLVLSLLVMITAGIEGSITLDIDLSRGDIIWILLGAPVILAILQLLLCPLSYAIEALVLRYAPRFRRP